MLRRLLRGQERSAEYSALPEARSRMRTLASRLDLKRGAGWAVSLKTIGWTLAILLVAIAIGTVWKAFSVWADKSLTPDQRLAALGNSFGAGTFALALVASGVALLAYWISLQRPRLLPIISSDDFEKGILHVGAGRPANGERSIVRLGGYLRNTPELVLNIAIKNISDWSARNVAVKVTFSGIRAVPHPAEWTIAARDRVTNQIVAINWEGGMDRAIHGQYSRDLPPIFLNGAILEAPATDCAFEVEAVAEGFRRSWRFGITWSAEYALDHKRKGVIEGYCGYPSSHVPEMRIVAVPASPSQTTRPMVGLPAGPPGKLRWFVIDEVPPAHYHIFATPLLDPRMRGTDAAGAVNHDPATFPVVAGELTVGVAITDWTSEQSESY